MKNNRYSDFKITHFPDKLKSFQDGVIAPPIYVRVKPYNACNHGCWWCVYSTGFRPLDKDNHIQSGMHSDMKLADQIPFAKMREILDDFKEMGVKAVTYSGGGEPLMYPDICATMERTLNYDIDLSIITNGQQIYGRRAETLASAKWVRVSIDYTNAAEMAASRNVPERFFFSILANLENFSRTKERECELTVNFIIHKDNIKGLGKFTKTLKDVGVENVRFSPMWVPNFLEYHTPLLEDVRAELAEAQSLVDSTFQVNSTYNISGSGHFPERAYHRCFFMQTVPVIGADQIVYACHNKAYSADGAIGSIKDQHFKDLWYSDAAKNAFEELDPMVTCRHECTADGKNKIIHGLLDAHQDNFV